MRDANRRNLRLGNFSSLILMGLTRNSNSRFAIRFWRLETGCWKLECGHEVRSAETGMAGDGGGKVEGQKRKARAQNPPFAENAKGWGTRKI